MTTTLLAFPLFDPFEFVEQLKATGVPEEQAKGHVRVLTTAMKQVDARLDEMANRRDKQSEERLNAVAEKNEKQVQGRLDGLATRQELELKLAIVEANLKLELEGVRKEIEVVRKELGTEIEGVRKEIALSKSETIKWTAAMFAAQTALIIGAMFGVMRMVQPPHMPAHATVQEVRPAPTVATIPPGVTVPAK
ncbi:MAG: hypothetical protein G8237_10480 [Magnetococcales bacterium]|nr:hypothetical protein [Magnetococcales bacterium]NGZ06770.1 hypothetical protein [Magnetococcales bacterium]